jgi:serine protease AprX
MNTVGTLTSTDDKIASYSSKGPSSIDQVVKPDLVAPGNRIISIGNGGTYLERIYPENAVAKQVYQTDGGTSAPFYFELSGASMATPMVAGAAALIRTRLKRG